MQLTTDIKGRGCCPVVGIFASISDNRSSNTPKLFCSFSVKMIENTRLIGALLFIWHTNRIFGSPR